MISNAACYFAADGNPHSVKMISNGAPLMLTCAIMAFRRKGQSDMRRRRRLSLCRRHPSHSAGSTGYLAADGNPHSVKMMLVNLSVTVASSSCEARRTLALYFS